MQAGPDTAQFWADHGAAPFMRLRASTWHEASTRTRVRMIMVAEDLAAPEQLVSCTLSRSQRALILCAPLVPTVATLVHVFLGGRLLSSLIGACVTGVVWYAFLFIPVEVHADRCGTVKLRTWFDETTVLAQDVLAINASSWNNGYVTIRHTAGSVHLLRGMSGLRRVIDLIRTVNPSVLLRAEPPSDGDRA